MPLRGLEFVENGLTVAYQGSAQPQELSITMSTARETDRAMVRISLRGLCNIICDGGAGGSHFLPMVGMAEPVNFSFGDDSLRYGPDYHHVLRVAGVSHRFIRTIVEELCPPLLQVTRLQIAGSLPITDPNSSVTEADIRAVLDDPTAYVGKWPDPGFPLEASPSERGMTVVVEFQKTLDSDTFEAIEERLVGFPGNISTFLSDDGTEVDITDLSRRLPRIGKKKRSVTAYYEHLGHAREPALAMLSNMLCRFHHEKAPIARARVEY